jgi:hypothetical protein
MYDKTLQGRVLNPPLRGPDRKPRPGNRFTPAHRTFARPFQSLPFGEYKAALSALCRIHREGPPLFMQCLLNMAQMFKNFLFRHTGLHGYLSDGKFPFVEGRYYCLTYRLPPVGGSRWSRCFLFPAHKIYYFAARRASLNDHRY